VRLVEDQDSVEQFAAQGADEALGELSAAVADQEL
jgi:hypothetical protein